MKSTKGPDLPQILGHARQLSPHQLAAIPSAVRKLLFATTAAVAVASVADFTIAQLLAAEPVDLFIWAEALRACAKAMPFFAPAHLALTLLLAIAAPITAWFSLAGPRVLFALEGAVALAAVALAPWAVIVGILAVNWLGAVLLAALLLIVFLIVLIAVIASIL